MSTYVVIDLHAGLSYGHVMLFVATGLSNGRRGGAGADGRDARDAGVRCVTRRQLDRASTAARVCRPGRYLLECEYVY